MADPAATPPETSGGYGVSLAQPTRSSAPRGLAARRAADRAAPSQPPGLRLGAQDLAPGQSSATPALKDRLHDPSPLSPGLKVGEQRIPFGPAPRAWPTSQCAMAATLWLQSWRPSSRVYPLTAGCQFRFATVPAIDHASQDGPSKARIMGGTEAQRMPFPTSRIDFAMGERRGVEIDYCPRTVTAQQARLLDNLAASTAYAFARLSADSGMSASLRYRSRHR